MVGFYQPVVRLTLEIGTFSLYNITNLINFHHRREFHDLQRPWLSLKLSQTSTGLKMAKKESTIQLHSVLPQRGSQNIFMNAVESLCLLLQKWEKEKQGFVGTQKWSLKVQ